MRRIDRDEQVLLDGEAGVVDTVGKDYAVIRFDRGAVRLYKTSELQQAYEDARLHFMTPAKDTVRLRPYVTEAERRVIERRDAYLRELDKQVEPHAKGVQEAVIARVSKAIADPNPPGASTLSRWYRRWLYDGRDTTQQVIAGRRERAPRLPREYLDLMHEVIEDVYLRRSKPTIRATYAVFRQRYQERGYRDKCPDISTMRRVIRRLDPLEVIARRDGRSAAREAARVAGTRIEPEFPLERVEVDTAHFNLGLLNDDGHYVGKVSLYLVIDVYSRAILGFAVHVGKAKEDAACAIHALRYAVSVKDDPAYPMHGLFHEIVVDSGPGYRAEATRAFLQRIAREVQTAPTRKGWAKPFVERLIRTLRDRFFRNLDGYLGKYDPSKYSDATLAKSARLTVSEFRQRVYDFIVHDYHNTPHRGLNGKTPLQVWRHGVVQHPPLTPDSLQELSRLRGLQETRVLSRVTGVFYQGQHFHSPALVDLYDRLAAVSTDTKIRVDVLVDPLDAGAVSVVDRITGELIEVPNTSSRATGKSFAELRASSQADATALTSDAGGQAPLLGVGEVLEKISNQPRRPGPHVVAVDESEPLDLGAFLESSAPAAVPARRHPRDGRSEAPDGGLPAISLGDPFGDDDDYGFED